MPQSNDKPNQEQTSKPKEESKIPERVTTKSILTHVRNEEHKRPSAGERPGSGKRE